MAALELAEDAPAHRLLQSNGQPASPSDRVRSSQESVASSEQSEQGEVRRQRYVACESEEGSDERRSVTHLLYRAARFEGEDEPSGEDWQKIIGNPCTVDAVLDWREGVSTIVDGLANHGGAEVIDRLIDRSLAGGSRYLYIALAPYASPDMQEKYASYFLAEDAYRDAFESRLPEVNQPGDAVACPDIYALDDWPDDFDYIPLPTAERLNDALSGGVPDCFEELVLFARAGRPEGQAMLEGFGDDAASQALRYLIETPVAEMDVVRLVRHMFDAREPVLWEPAFFALGSGGLQAEDEASRRMLAGLVPRDPATALQYASVMDDVTGDESYWAGVTSTIIMDSPEVLGDDGFWDFRLSPDLARLDDWLDGQSPDELAVFVERLDVEKRLELPKFIEPDQLTIVTFARLLSEFYDQSVEPPQAWVAYFEDNLADWMLTHLPEELLEADVWDRSHNRFLLRPGEVNDALGRVLTAMGPLQMFPYLDLLAQHESPALVRIAHGMRLMIAPNYANYRTFVASGVAPELVADNLDDRQVRGVLMTGLDSERPEALLELIEHLDCRYFEDVEQLQQLKGTGHATRENGPVNAALQARMNGCER